MLPRRIFRAGRHVELSHLRGLQAPTRGSGRQRSSSRGGFLSPCWLAPALAESQKRPLSFRLRGPRLTCDHRCNYSSLVHKPLFVAALCKCLLGESRRCIDDLDILQRDFCPLREIWLTTLRNWRGTIRQIARVHGSSELICQSLYSSLVVQPLLLKLLQPLIASLQFGGLLCSIFPPALSLPHPVYLLCARANRDRLLKFCSQRKLLV
mmetsp:Transcript_70892/g.114275  ORF Transcript_70892/g.114275 Transcript_70892/m.114275 type:complete len:209 (+) Transcript_70892:413-1039(+)